MEILIGEFEEFWAEMLAWESFKDDIGYIIYLARFTYLIDLMGEVPLIDIDNLELLRDWLAIEMADAMSR